MLLVVETQPWRRVVLTLAVKQKVELQDLFRGVLMVAPGKRGLPVDFLAGVQEALAAVEQGDTTHVALV
jgi:hypothetical protein